MTNKSPFISAQYFLLYFLLMLMLLPLSSIESRLVSTQKYDSKEESVKRTFCAFKIKLHVVYFIEIVFPIVSFFGISFKVI